MRQAKAQPTANPTRVQPPIWRLSYPRCPYQMYERTNRQLELAMTLYWQPYRRRCRPTEREREREKNSRSKAKPGNKIARDHSISRLSSYRWPKNSKQRGASSPDTMQRSVGAIKGLKKKRGEEMELKEAAPSWGWGIQRSRPFQPSEDQQLSQALLQKHQP